MASRISSASSRRGACRQTRRLAGVDGEVRGARRRVEAIGPARHDRPDEPLDRPAVADEPRGQVVEQFRVRGRVARRAEVVDAPHQARAEEVLPDPVDEDAGRERVLLAREPTGQLEPAALRRVDLRGVGHVQDAEEPPGTTGPSFSASPRSRISVSAGDLRVADTERDLAAVGRRVGQGEQLGLEPCSSSEPGDGTPGPTVGRRLQPLGSSRRWPGTPSGLREGLGGRRRSLRDLPGSACAVPQGDEHRRVVVVEPAAAHLVADPGAEVGAGGRCRPGRNSRPSGSGRTCGRGNGRSSPSSPGSTGSRCRSARRRCPSRTGP